MLRCTGIKYDLRLHKNFTYAHYSYVNFFSYIGQNGDCYDRFLLRMNEINESLFIINQLIFKCYKFFFKNLKKNFFLKKISKKKKVYSKLFMENIINHFKY